MSRFILNHEHHDFLDLNTLSPDQSPSFITATADNKYDPRAIISQIL